MFVNPNTQAVPDVDASSWELTWRNTSDSWRWPRSRTIRRTNSSYFPKQV